MIIPPMVPIAPTQTVVVPSKPLPSSSIISPPPSTAPTAHYQPFVPMPHIALLEPNAIRILASQPEHSSHRSQTDPPLLRTAS